MAKAVDHWDSAALVRLWTESDRSFVVLQVHGLRVLLAFVPVVLALRFSPDVAPPLVELGEVGEWQSDRLVRLRDACGTKG